MNDLITMLGIYLYIGEYSTTTVPYPMEHTKFDAKVYYVYKHRPGLEPNYVGKEIYKWVVPNILDVL